MYSSQMTLGRTYYYYWTICICKYCMLYLYFSICVMTGCRIRTWWLALCPTSYWSSASVCCYCVGLTILSQRSRELSPTTRQLAVMPPTMPRPVITVTVTTAPIYWPAFHLYQVSRSCWLLLRPWKGCDVLWCVCLSVCLSVCSHTLKTIWLNSAKYSVHVTCGRGFVFVWQSCSMLCTSGFMDGVSFVSSHHHLCLYQAVLIKYKSVLKKFMWIIEYLFTAWTVLWFVFRFKFWRLFYLFSWDL